jgi:hypothetical protein
MWGKTNIKKGKEEKRRKKKEDCMILCVVTSELLSPAYEKLLSVKTLPPFCMPKQYISRSPFQDDLETGQLQASMVSKPTSLSNTYIRALGRGKTRRSILSLVVY